MATFRCLQSGQMVTFNQPHDIDSMKGHAGYQRIDEPEILGDNDEHLILMQPPKAQKRPWRPRKVDNA
ncbi:MAG: hypothetical protein EBU08_00900 [Micrococcales bacterium]|nr:hypothetical protein [Micrococcales bacterium]